MTATLSSLHHSIPGSSFRSEIQKSQSPRHIWTTNLPPERPAPKIVSPYNRPDDEFGYAVYSVVVMASLSQQAAIHVVRQGVKHQRSMIPAHVTVKGTFCEVPSLEKLIDRIQEIAIRVKSFRLEFQLDSQNYDSISGIKRNGNEYAGLPICRYYNVKELTGPWGKYGKYKAPPRGALAREYKRLVGEPNRTDRISFLALKGKRILARLETVTRAYNWKALARDDQYSRVAELIRIIDEDFGR